MTASSFLRLVPMLVVLGAIGFAQPQPARETRVNAAFDKLEAEFLDRLNVSEMLSGGRSDLARLMRRDPATSRSWQLEPSVAASMTPDEIFGFVVARANALLACRIAQLAQKRLDAPPPSGNRGGAAATPGAGTAAQAAPAGAAVVQRLWKADTEEGQLRVSPGCNVLLDRDGQPATLATKDAVVQSDRLMQRSVHATSRQQLFEAAVEPRLQAEAESRLRANLQYLRQEYGGAPVRETDIEAILGRTGTQVFSRQVLVFQAFVASTADLDRLILLVPLSE